MKNIFAEICKVDDEKRMVYGYASTEALDSQGEIVTKDAMAAALDDYMKFANIREMHQPSAVGVAKSAEMDDKGCFISAHVVDDSAWAKVKAGVYKGFSIGGKAIAKAEGIISSLKLSEISLVDRPANPEALITVWKADGAAPTPEQAVTELAALLDKGDITPQRLVELAQAELAKSEERTATDAPVDAPVDTPAVDTPAVEVTPEAPASEPAAEPAAPAADDAAKSDEIPTSNGIAKGMYTVAWLSELLASLNNLRQDVAWEAEYEADGSALPAMLKDAVELLAGILTDMVAEETKELTEEAKADHVVDVAKAGKSISAKNMEKLQAMHDHCAAMGAACKAEKHDHAHDVSKAHIDDIAAVRADLQKLNDANETLKSEIAALKKQPAAGKALLNAIAVSKAQDGGGIDADDTNKIAPVADAKGEVNDVASLIKAIHSKGGVVA